MTTQDERCTATSKTTRKRCRRLAHPGETLCYLHGWRSYLEIKLGSPRRPVQKIPLEDEWAELQRKEVP